MMPTNWWQNDLITLTGVTLLSKPDMTERKIKGVTRPQRFGRAEFQVKNASGETLTIHVGTSYWDAAVSQFADIHGDQVNVTYLPMPWAACGRSGTKLYFYEINETLPTL